MEPSLRAVVWPLLLAVDDAQGSHEQRAVARSERRRRFHHLHSHRLKLHALALDPAAPAAASTAAPSAPTILSSLLSATGEVWHHAADDPRHSSAVSSSAGSLRRDASFVSEAGAVVGAADAFVSCVDPRAAIAEAEAERPLAPSWVMVALFREAADRIKMDAPRTSPPFEDRHLRVLTGSHTTTASDRTPSLQVRATQRRNSRESFHVEGLARGVREWLLER